jgi:hypothetical protein
MEGIEMEVDEWLTKLQWKPVERGVTPFLVGILFTDGRGVYAGWLETVQPEEDLLFFDAVERKFHWDGVVACCELPCLGEGE